jgi:hypothetical protein
MVGQEETDSNLPEGNKYTPQLLATFPRFSVNPLVRTVCEVGFNFGHSAIMWLYNNPNTRLVSFDLLESPHKTAGKQFVEILFPGRVTIIAGDSTVEIPKFYSSNPSLKCGTFPPQKYN